jgi:hypothetical protein
VSILVKIGTGSLPLGPGISPTAAKASCNSRLTTVATRVERSLYERANGYSYDAVKIFMPAGSKQPVVVHYIEHCPPDVAAAFIWLKNCDPERWRDVQNVEHAIGKYIISDRPMTPEQWAAERATIIDDVVEELPAPSTK